MILSHIGLVWIGMNSVLRPRRQHSIGYLGDGFTGQKTQPTVSKYWKKRRYKGQISQHDVYHTEIWGVDMSPRRMAAATCCVLSCSAPRFLAALICDASLLATSSFWRLSADGAWCWRLGAITGLVEPATKPSGLETSLTRLRLANICSIFWSIYHHQHTNNNNNNNK